MKRKKKKNKRLQIPNWWRCENCKFRKEESVMVEGISESFCSLMEDKKIPVTSIDGRSVWIVNPSKFGCIHFESRDESNEN